MFFISKAKAAINEFNGCLSGDLEGCDENEQAKLIVESITYKCIAFEKESTDGEKGKMSLKDKTKQHVILFTLYMFKSVDAKC